MRAILITGATGIGKSRLVSTLAGRHKFAIFDAVRATAREWVAPEPDACPGVVIDHIHLVDDARNIVPTASTWCERHSVPLWLVGTSRGELEAMGIDIPRDTIELHLQTEEAKAQPAAQRINLSFDQALLLAPRIAAAEEPLKRPCRITSEIGPITFITLGLLAGAAVGLAAGNSLGLGPETPMFLGVAVSAIAIAFAMFFWYTSDGWIIQRQVTFVADNEDDDVHETWWHYGNGLPRHQALGALQECRGKWPEYEFRVHRVQVAKAIGKRPISSGSSGESKY